jgi:UDP-3-O-[3-hydroxymyristoyl] glucosamine N-acyltransferase
VADHVTIGEGARVGAQSGVPSDIPAGQTWFGYPALPGREYFRIISAMRKRT